MDYLRFSAQPQENRNSGFRTASKEHVKLKEKNLPLLMRYAKAFSIEKINRRYLEMFCIDS